MVRGRIEPVSVKKITNKIPKRMRSKIETAKEIANPITAYQTNANVKALPAGDKVEFSPQAGKDEKFKVKNCGAATERADCGEDWPF